MNRRTAVIDANGHRAETKYNLRGEAISVTNANGETAKSEYDALGRLTKVIDPLGYETRFQYDANGNLTCRIDANATSAATDPGHQPVNAQGCTESRTYDELNRLTQSKDAQNNVTAYGYDLLGHRTQLTDAESHVTTFRYDDLGRLTEVVDPLIETPSDKTPTFAWDEAGNLIEQTDRKGQITRHTFDALNRKTRSDYLADGSLENFTYDAFGDLIETQNGAVTYDYTYTPKHQLQSKTDGRLNRTLSWTYDPAGNLQTKTDYQGQQTTYQYDSTNRLVAETNPEYLEVSYHYDGAGRLLDRILSNGAHTRYAWDAGGRLTQLANTTVTGQTVNDTSYTRDRIGNILSQTETSGTGQTAGTTSFSYDPEYRLLSANYPGTANDESFTYDKVGNRKTHTKAGTTRYYAYDAGNRLQNIRTGSVTGSIESSYSYDGNGSLTTETGPRAKTLSWDPRNRPSTIAANSFEYDPSGYRIQKTDSAGAKTYLLEGEHLEAIYTDTGTAQATYFRGSVIDEIVNGYQFDASGKFTNYTYLHDALQSVLGQSGHEGTILATQSYGAFGNSLGQTGSSSNKLKYTGREEDQDIGLYQYRARYYDPGIGRFISEDPLGFDSGDVNFYAYVGNNPVNANDPGGMRADIYVTPLPNGQGYKYTAVGPLGASKPTMEVNYSAVIKGTFNATTDNGGNGPIGSGIYTLSPRPHIEVKPGIAGIIQWAGAIIGGNRTGDVNRHEGMPVLSNTDTPNLIKYSDGTSRTNITIHPGLDPVTGEGGRSLGCFVCNNPDFGRLNQMLQNNYGNGGAYLHLLSGKDAAGAAGGFVLYPNKSNTNQMRSVYSK